MHYYNSKIILNTQPMGHTKTQTLISPVGESYGSSAHPSSVLRPLWEKLEARRLQTPAGSVLITPFLRTIIAGISPF